jgi:hypothetical protein
MHPFWSSPSTDADVVEITLRGRAYRMPRNWIMSAGVLAGSPKLYLKMQATYPALQGVTAENLSLFPEGFRHDRAGWDRAVVTIQPADRNRRFRIPDQFGREVTAHEAIQTHLSDPKKTLWFSGGGSAIWADNDHGGIFGWSDVVELHGGALFRLSYGVPLLQHWIQIRLRMSVILLGFLVA